MKFGSLSLAAVILLAWSGMAEAKGHIRHGHCPRYYLFHDYTRGDFLGPYTFVYPAANWGPFFRCHVYRSAVIDYLPPYP